MRKQLVALGILCFAMIADTFGQGGFLSPGAAGAAASTAATQVNAAATVVTATAAVPGVTPPPNLWDFLGVPQMLRGSARVVSRVRFRLNSILPFGKKRPPIDPPPPGMASPAASSAGQMQKVEANAEANVQAIKYLGNFGCSDCFPEIEEALYHALSDCMPGPRLAALQVINAHGGSCCTQCSGNSCCSLRIREALHDIAHGVDELGCPKVTDPKHLRLAREALRKCSCVPLKVAKPNATNLEAVPEVLPIPGSDDPSEPSSATKPANPTAPVSFLASDHTERGDENNLADLLVAEVGNYPIRLGHLVTVEERRSQFPAVSVLIERLEGMIDFHAVTLQAERTKFVAPAVAGRRAPQSGEALYARAYVEAIAAFEREVSDRDAYEYFESHREQFVLPTTVIWEQLSVPIRYFPSEQHAFRVAEHLRQAASGLSSSEPRPDFQSYDYVVEVSDPTPIDEIPAHTWQALKDLGENEVGSIVRVGDKFVIHSVRRRSAERPGTFSEMEDLVREAILDQRHMVAMQEAVRQARATTSIWVVPNLGDVLSRIQHREPNDSLVTDLSP